MIISNQTIDQLRASLKHINMRMEKLGRTIDQLDILSYQYKQLSVAYQQLATESQKLSAVLDHIDDMAFEVCQDYTLLNEAVKEGK